LASFQLWSVEVAWGSKAHKKTAFDAVARLQSLHRVNTALEANCSKIIRVEMSHMGDKETDVSDRTMRAIREGKRDVFCF
jgi:hypothetical protein